MTEIAELPLGPEGSRYVLSCLEQGTGLCSKLLPRVIAGGSTYAVVPEGTPLARASKFDAGGLMSRREMKGWLASHLNGLRLQNPEGAVIFQDIWAQPSDPFLKRVKSTTLFEGSEVYHFIEAEKIDSWSLEKEISDITSFLLIGVFTSASALPKVLQRDRFIEEAVVDKWIEKAIEVYVSAYDQEGLVVWHQ